MKHESNKIFRISSSRPLVRPQKKGTISDRERAGRGNRTSGREGAREIADRTRNEQSVRT